MSLLQDVNRTYDGTQNGSWCHLKCKYCNKEVTGFVVASLRNIRWLLCPSCRNGFVRSEENIIYPVVSYGPKIEGLSKEVDDAYQEARNCFSIGAYTSVELMCRNILMYVSVEKGAEENKNFVYYLEYLRKKELITKSITKWADLIRDHGNKAAHLLEKPNKERAESTLMFTIELLKLIYEMTHISAKYIE